MWKLSVELGLESFISHFDLNGFRLVLEDYFLGVLCIDKIPIILVGVAAFRSLHTWSCKSVYDSCLNLTLLRYYRYNQ